jgi:threonine dehydrogenase-like Zn-dependent dehydrogenase
MLPNTATYYFTLVLLLGAGPTGLILAQLLKLNGAMRVVIAANKGIKMDIAKQLEAGDEYIELDRYGFLFDVFSPTRY